MSLNLLSFCYIEKYNVEALNTEVVLYCVENEQTQITAVFVYDGVYYTLEGVDVTLEEILDADLLARQYVRAHLSVIEA